MITIKVSGNKGSCKTLLIGQFEEVLNRFNINYITKDDEHTIEILDDDIRYKIIKPMMLDDKGNRSIFDDVDE